MPLFVSDLPPSLYFPHSGRRSLCQSQQGETAYASDMTEAHLFITTFNCGKKTPTGAEFTKHLNEKLPEDVSNLYVFGFQEITSILDATDANIVNKKLIWIADNLITCLKNKYEMQSFAVVSIAHFGAVGLIIISPFISKITKIHKSLGYPVGTFYTNLKGGVGVRVFYESTEFTFVCMHLNAGEKVQHMLRRNQDLYNILSKLAFDDGWCVLKPGAHCFIFGDLNYRATGGFGLIPGRQETEQREQDESEGRGQETDSDIVHRLENDELTLLRKGGLILEDFEEPEIHFKPSYKYIVGARNYNKKRIPSFCDRILFLGYPDASKTPRYKVLEYDTISECLISDHLPVYMIVNLNLTPPERNINDAGYLIDRTTQLNEFGKSYKIIGYSRYILRVSFFTTFLLGTLLYLTVTNKGRMVSLGFVILVYTLLKWNGLL